MTKRCTWMIVGALFVLPAAGVAQGGGMQAWQGQTVADLEQMRDKFISLAEAFPEEMWDWTPMEGVRSVRDVMVLIVTEGHVFPGMWGADPPMGGRLGFRRRDRPSGRHVEGRRHQGDGALIRLHDRCVREHDGGRPRP